MLYQEDQDLRRSGDQVDTLLGDGRKVVQECERPALPLARRSIVARRDLRAGLALRLDDICYKSGKMQYLNDDDLNCFYFITRYICNQYQEQE